MSLLNTVKKTNKQGCHHTESCHGLYFSQLKRFNLFLRSLSEEVRGEVSGESSNLFITHFRTCGITMKKDQQQVRGAGGGESMKSWEKIDTFTINGSSDSTRSAAAGLRR